MKHHTCIAGAGLGLRTPHIAEIIETSPNVNWFELLVDNHLDESKQTRLTLEAICAQYPITIHGVNLSLASVTPLKKDYLAKIKRFIDTYKPAWYSEHLSFSFLNDTPPCHTADLLPIPYHEESFAHVAQRIEQVQDAIKQPLVVENISAYLPLNTDASLSEAQFLYELAKNTGCKLLLDLNNIYVSHLNDGLDCERYLHSLDSKYIQEIHLAGHSFRDGLAIDTHGAQVCDAVWDLYHKAISKFGHIPTLIEWDNNIPTFEILYEEGLRAQRILDLQTTPMVGAA